MTVIIHLKNDEIIGIDATSARVLKNTLRVEHFSQYHNRVYVDDFDLNDVTLVYFDRQLVYMEKEAE